MPLKILCAGCPPEEKERAESDVRRALGRRTDGEAWMVSLVKMRDRWSVTLDGPGARGLTCLAPEGRVSESILEALGGPAGAAPAPPPAAPPAAARPEPAPASFAPSSFEEDMPAPVRSAAAGARHDRHECASCRGAFVVSYDGQGDEGEETVAVACPHCWHRNYVLVGESAAETREFTAEKA